MKLSVITVCLNEENRLPRCLEAISRVDHAGLEVELIVVDGGSTDRTREVAAQHGARVVSSPKGIPRQRNVGARAASGEVLAYLDADVEILDGWFATVARHFAGRDGARLLLGAPPNLPDDASWIARAYALHWGAPPSADDQQPSDDVRLLSTQSLVLGRIVYDEVEGFREDLGVNEDTQLILEAKDRGVRVVCDPALRYVHHGEPRTLRDFYRRFAWGANYDLWWESIRRGDWAQVWRRQYFYGAIVGAEVAALGLSLAVPVGGWLVGLPLSVGALVTTFALPALATAHRHRAYDKIAELCVMYGAYGLATASALAGIGRNKSLRWR